MISKSSIASLLLALSDVFRTVTAGILYYDPLDSCAPGYQNGMAISCCDGRCFDGTGIGQPGACYFYNDQCIDGMAAHCGINQVWTYVPWSGFDAGIGDCHGAGQCVWGGIQWRWNCCDCPANTTSVVRTCEERYAMGIHGGSGCAKCSKPDETLTFNNVSDSHVCDGSDYRQRACDMGHAAQKTLATISLANTMLGAFCPTNLKVVLPIVVMKEAVDILQAVKDKGSGWGIDSTKTAAVSGGIAAYSSFLIAARVAAGGTAASPFAAAVAAAYAAACEFNTGMSMILTISGLSIDKWNGIFCNTTQKRSTPHWENGADLGPERFTSDAVRRDGTAYNPCSQVFDYVPSDTTALQTLVDDCWQLSGFTATDTFSPDLANATRILQKFCGTWGYDSNSAMLIDYANFLTALHDAIPYCDAPPGFHTTTISATATLSSQSLASTSFLSQSSVPGNSNKTSTLATTSTFKSATTMASSTSKSLSGITTSTLLNLSSTISGSRIASSASLSSPLLRSTSATTTTKATSTTALPSSIRSTTTSSSSPRFSVATSPLSMVGSTKSILSSSRYISSPNLTSGSAVSVTSSTKIVQTTSVKVNTTITVTQSAAIATNYQQCGGSQWRGPTVCRTGWNCTNTDPDYWQCWPKPYNATYCKNHMYDDCGGTAFNGTRCCPEGASCLPVNQWTNTCQWQ